MSTVKRLTKIGAIVLAFFVVTGASAYLTLNYIIRGTGTQVVPALEGKDVVAVLELLSNLDLNIKIGGLQYNADIPVNQVISQDPQAGTEIKRGRSVHIVISKGPVEVQVPNLRGLSEDQAATLLEGNGLCRGTLSRLHGSPLSAGMVTAQAPFAGRKVLRGTCVDLLVSRGPHSRAIIMPELGGLRLQDAVELLEGDDLTSGRVSYVYERYKPPDVVIGQQPPAGHRVTLNTLVDLRINRRAPATRRADTARNRLFRYRIDSGFLKKHIRVEWKTFALSTDLFDSFVGPGEDLWLLVPALRDGTLLLYQNGQLISAHYYPAG